ncbi:MAG: UDP-2,4-diacetamido-2,4,6-trideoxy-beta-L-altropyranose hydrolase [Proteobacteria bacterium]|nr:UDP-2,4-diacetamido-2,4,6-trideoxy-beta-L-altropyranose hydrolase [Pseudomonadota bacterium]
MRIGIRTDSSNRIGGGHVGRCLALAHALERWGHQVLFICRDLPGSVSSRVEQAGFPITQIKVLEQNSRDTLEIDIAVTAEFLRENACDWLIVDAYHVDTRWESHMLPLVDRLLVIDDLVDRPHDCTMLVDPSGSDDEALRGDDCHADTMLLGPRFALLRPEFFARRHLNPGVACDNRQHPQVAVFFGQVDASGQTENTLRSKADVSDKVVFHVVLPKTNPRHEDLTAQFSGVDDIILHDEIGDMAEFLSGMDFAIGGGGVTLWERCCLGIPSIVIELADNQARSIDIARNANAIKFLGNTADIGSSQIASSIDNFMRVPDSRASLAKAGMALVDGLGAKRVAAAMSPLEVTHAVAEDVRVLWDWANDDDVRANSYSPETIDWNSHVDWFQTKSADLNNEIYIARLNGEPVAQIRFDIFGGCAEIDISVDRRHRGFGFGEQTMLQALETFWADHPGIDVEASVKSGNSSSRALFSGCGFARQPDLEPDVVAFRYQAPKASLGEFQTVANG